MNDLMIAGLLFAFLIGLAISAPIWGVDSRDGVASDQSARRAAWLHGRVGGHPTVRTLARRAQTDAVRPASIALAGALRTVAYRLDAEAAR